MIGGGLLIAVGAISANPALVKGGFLLLAAGAIAALTAQNPPSLQGARQAELQMATSASGVPVPVIFGEQRVTGNFMEYDKSQLRTVEIRQSTPGGKGGGGGGGSQVVGYEYFLSYEQGICMGEIDAVAQVISTPGETKLMNETPVVATVANTTTTAASFTRPAIAATVSVTLGSTALLAVNNAVEIPNYGKFTVTAIADATHATLRLDEKLGSQISGWGGNPTVPSGSAVLHIMPASLAATRKFNFDDVDEFTVDATVTLDGFGEFKVLSKTGTTANLELTRIISSGTVIAGTNVRTYQDPAQAFTDDTLEIALAGGQESGTVRLYCGTPWQTRLSGGDPYYAHGMHYRHLCWALFMDYKIGTHPQAQSHHFILRRLPKCYRDDGSIITGLKTRGSNSATHANYQQANPAAIIYEILTDKVWGRGMSSALIDESSWIAASEFFAAQNIGLGVTLDRADKLANILAGIRETARVLLLWDGDKLKFRTLLDTATVHQRIVTITKSQVSDVKFTRPTWTSTFNEVRAEFANRQRNYKSDAVSAQDTANFNTVGAVNQKRVTLYGVTETTLAQRLAAMLLKEVSYPLGVLSFKMNRTQSHLEPGDIIRFVWDEWSGGTVTGYYQVSTPRPGGSEDEAITVQATEDPDLSAVEAEETSVTPPTVLNWHQVTGNGQHDLNLIQPQPGNTLPVLPLAVVEAPAILTGGAENRLAFLGQKPTPGLTGISGHAAQFDGDYKYIGTTTTFAVTGSLLTEYAAGPRIDRTTGFEFSLTDPDTDEGTILQANRVAATSDDLSALANSENDYILIGEEIMQVGKITKLDANRYQASNLIRGLFGTKVATVAQGATFFYTRTQPATVSAEKLDAGNETRFRGYPVDAKGVANIGSDIYIAHAAPNNRIFLGVGKRPLAPEPYSMTQAGLDCTIKVRPQFFDRAAATQSFEQAANTLITTIEPMRFMVEALDGGGAVLQGKTLTAHTFTADELADRTKGMVTIAFTRPGLAATIRVYSELDGHVSVDAAAFPV